MVQPVPSQRSASVALFSALPTAMQSVADAQETLENLATSQGPEHPIPAAPAYPVGPVGPSGSRPIIGSPRPIGGTGPGSLPPGNPAALPVAPTGDLIFNSPTSAADDLGAT